MYYRKSLMSFCATAGCTFPTKPKRNETLVRFRAHALTYWQRSQLRSLSPLFAKRIRSKASGVVRGAIGKLVRKCRGTRIVVSMRCHDSESLIGEQPREHVLTRIYIYVCICATATVCFTPATSLSASELLHLVYAASNSNVLHLDREL